MKQVIKSRILADCWKKHQTYGTIPIEIHVMAALSTSEYVLPEPRPWDPKRFDYWATGFDCTKPVLAGSIPLSLDDKITPLTRTSLESTAMDSPSSSTASTAESGGNRAPDARSSVSSLPSIAAITADAAARHAKTSSISSDITPTPGFPHLSSSLHSKLIPNDWTFGKDWHWQAGAIHRGHPSIIPLLEFFEDAHFYYLILPAATPSFPPSPYFPPVTLPDAHPSHAPPSTGSDKKFPSDMFDLVERYPYGLPTALIRTYLGQIADGLAFLHARGICHRDIKDENIVLAEDGRCWLIDFGSSGVVRKEGWDTFSGT